MYFVTLRLWFSCSPQHEQIQIHAAPFWYLSGGPGVHHSMDRYTQPLADRLGHSVEKLHLVHRLDKETTGVILLAK